MDNERPEDAKTPEGGDQTPASPAAEDPRTVIATPKPGGDAETGQTDDATRIVTAAPPAAAPQPGGDAPVDTSLSQVPIGTIINNNYEVKELLSAGGMGEVFRGENTFTGDAVAIKIVLQSLAHDPKIAALFMREARVLCGLSDQAIVRYYNFVRDADLDRFCLIMEFISGVSLSDHVADTGPLGVDQARGLMRRLAEGLERAHSMDVVHRDLSPDNVMLRDGIVDQGTLIDFGIAKSSEMAENTLHGQLAGKFKYISPEQLGHHGGEIGPRTDIYGLALMIAAALRGAPIDMGSSVVEAVNARSTIPDLSDVPDALRPLLAHMLEPNPANRPARMRDVIRLLDDPGLIPPQYGAAPGDADDPFALSPKDDRTVIAGAQAQTAPGTLSPGLQVPGGTTHRPSSLVPGAEATPDASASPFGPPPTTGAPVFAPGLTAPPPQTAPPAGQQTTARGSRRRRRKSSSGGALRWVLVFILIAGSGGYAAYRQGLLPIGVTETALPEDTVAPDTVTQTPQGPMTRATFLAGYNAGPCSYAARIASGPDAGTIEGFAQRAGVFAALPDAYEAAFGTRPAVIERGVNTGHCAVLNLVRNLQGGDVSPPVLTLDTAEVASGGSVIGRLSDRRGRPIWLVLVTAAGGVYNLADRLEEQADGSATFSFGLTNTDGSTDPQPQLILAVAADAPLIAAAAATDGAIADSLLPLIEAEIIGRDGAAAAALGHLTLLP